MACPNDCTNLISLAADGVINGLSYNTATGLLSATTTNGATYSDIVPDVASMSYDDTTGLLTLTKNDGSTVTETIETCCPDAAIAVASSAFADTSNPTQAEAQAWITTNHADAVPGQLFYFAGTGTALVPDFVWELDGGGTSLEIQSPAAGITQVFQIPASAFSNNDVPTDAEVTAYIATNGPFDAGTVLHYPLNGTITNPDYSWQVTQTNTGLRIEDPNGPPSVQIPAASFLNSDQPTAAEVNTYLAANPQAIGTHVYVVGQGSTSDPDWVWHVESGNTSTNVESPEGQCAEAPDAAFTDTAAPTVGEVETWAATEGWTNGIITYPGDNGTTDEPDWAWSLCNGTAFRIEDPAAWTTSNEILDAEFADPTAPTEAEVLTYYGANGGAAAFPAGSVFYSIGNGTATNPDYVWYVDAAGAITQIESPTNDPAGSEEIPDTEFVDATAPTLAEVNTWLAANPQNPGSVVYVVGSGTTDNPDFVWHIDNAGTPTNIEDTDCNCDLTPQTVPDSEFVTPTSPTTAEVETWLAANGPFEVGTIVSAVGNGTAEEPEYSWVVESTTDVRLIESPASLTQDIDHLDIGAAEFVDADNPTIAEVEAYIAANISPLKAGSTIALAGLGDTDEPDYVWTMDETGSVRLTESPPCCPAQSEIDSTDFVNPAVPTEVEVTTWLGANPQVDGSIVYLIGNGSASDPDFAWHIVGGVPVRIEEPGGGGSAEIPSTEFADENNPTEAEVDAYLAANPQAPGTFVYLVGQGTTDNPDWTWVVENDLTSLNIDNPGDNLQQAVPDGAFLDPTAPTDAELQTWILNNGPFLPGTMFYLIGAGSIEDPDYVWHMGNDLTTMNVESPVAGSADSVEIPDTEFADPDNPTEVEVNTWLVNNPQDAGTIVYLIGGGSATNPDFAWHVDNGNTSTNIEAPCDITINVPSASLVRNGVTTAGGNLVDFDNGDGAVDLTFCEGFERFSFVTTDPCVGVGADYMIRDFEVDAGDPKNLIVTSAPEHLTIGSTTDFPAGQVQYIPPPTAVQQDLMPLTLTINNLSDCRTLRTLVVWSGISMTMRLEPGDGSMRYEAVPNLLINGAVPGDWQSFRHNVIMSLEDTSVGFQKRWDVGGNGYNTVVDVPPGTPLNLSVDVDIEVEQAGGSRLYVQGHNLSVFGSTT